VNVALRIPTFISKKTYLSHLDDPLFAEYLYPHYKYLFSAAKIDNILRKGSDNAVMFILDKKLNKLRFGLGNRLLSEGKLDRLTYLIKRFPDDKHLHPTTNGL